jgi:hypothetical protein
MWMPSTSAVEGPSTLKDEGTILLQNTYRESNPAKASSPKT